MDYPLSPRSPARAPRHRPARRPRGFTLVELLTVIAIIVILAGILIPVIGNLTTKARAAKSASNLRSIGSAMDAYTLDNQGYLPAPEAGGGGITANPLAHTWLEELVKYLDGQMVGTEVTQWPDSLTDPQYLVNQSGVISSPDVRGYGMMIYPLRPAGTSTPFTNTRQKKASLPDLARNIIVGCSLDTLLEPGADGTFPTGGIYGDPQRFDGAATYLFGDGHVNLMTPEEAAVDLAVRTPGS